MVYYPMNYNFFYLLEKDYNPCFTKRYTTGYLQCYVQLWEV